MTRHYVDHRVCRYSKALNFANSYYNYCCIYTLKKMVVKKMAISSFMRKTTENVSITLKNAMDFKKRPAATLGIFGGLQGVFVIAFSSILHYMAEPFTFSSHWVSNMGVGPNGSAFAFNYGLMISANLMGMFIIALTAKLWGFEQKGVRSMAIIGGANGVAAVTGIFILTINPMFGNIILHAIGAYMYFTNSIIFFVFATLAMHYAKITQKWHEIMTAILLVINIGNIPIQFYAIRFLLYPELPASDLGFAEFASILGSMDPALGLVRIFEWMSLIGFFVWVIGTGIMLARQSFNKTHNSQSRKINSLLYMRFSQLEPIKRFF